jgi:DNA-binding transcriptional LysR family regulator
MRRGPVLQRPLAKMQFTKYAAVGWQFRKIDVSEPDWSDFKVLLALAKEGSVSGAARSLGVDGSTVSRRLAALEKAVGATLILRGGRKFALTPEGKSAIAAAEAIATAVSSAKSAIRTAKQGVEGVVKFSFVSSIVPVLMPLLAEMAAKYPLLTLEMQADNRRMDLAKGEADVALRMARPSEPDLIARRAVVMGWGVYAAKNYAAKYGLPASHGELSSHRLVHYIEELHVQPAIRWLEDFRQPNAPIMRVNSTDMAVNVIASGKSIGVVPCFEAENRDELIRVFPEPVALSPGWIVYHETARNTARVRVVVGALAEFLEARADFFAGRAPVG